MHQGEDAQLVDELVDVHDSVSQHSSRTSHSGAMKLLELQAQQAEEEAQREMQKIALEVEQQQLQQRLRMLDAQREASSRMARIKEAMIRESLADDSSSVMRAPTGRYKSQQARNYAKEPISQSFVEGSTVPKVVAYSTTDSPKQGVSVRSTSATPVDIMPVTHIADAESLRVGTSSAKQVDHAHSFAFGRQATTHVPDAEPAMVRGDLIKQMNLSHTSVPGTKVRFDDTSYAAIVSNAPAFNSLPKMTFANPIVDSTGPAWARSADDYQTRHELLRPHDQRPLPPTDTVYELKNAFADALSEVKNDSARPRVEIEKFSGDPLRYYKFEYQIDSHIDSRICDPRKKLDLLLSQCTGEALRAIEGCLYLPPEIGYVEARKRLQQRFGQRTLVIEMYVEQLTVGPCIKHGDYKALTELADQMYNCYMTLRGWGGSASLDLQDNLRRIYSRLPNGSRERFDDICCRLHIAGQLPTFRDLMEFMQGEATRASLYFTRQHSQGFHHPRDRSKPNYAARLKSKPTAKVSTFSTKKIETESAQNANAASRTLPKCSDCNLPYPLWKCESFKAKSVDERWVIARKGPCFNCLSSNHKLSDCKSTATCKTCGKRHHTLLHKSSNGAEDVFENPGKGDVPPSTNGRVAYALHKGKQNKIKRFKVVPVEIWGENPSKSAFTYAFMDDGSDTSIITADLMRRLGVKPSNDSRDIHTANSVSNHNVTSVPIHVKGIQDTDTFCVKDVVVFDKITDISESIPTNDVAAQYPHLKDIEFPRLQTNEVGLLLGNDIHEAFRVTDQRYGDYGQPFGLKTMLGWTLFGGDYSADNACDCDSVVHVNFVRENDLQDGIEQILNTLTSDFADLDKNFEVRPSVEDNMAARIMESTVAKVGKHYQVGLPWRGERLKLPPSRRMAERRLDYMKKRFKTDPELFEKYKSKIHDYFENGYACIVPSDKVATDNDKLFYIPHHSTGKKFRIVFDCAARSRGISLNDCLLQGFDNTNSMIGVLLRFRQEDIAFVGDIKAMFHQILVDPEDRDALRFLWWPNDDYTLPPVDCQMVVHPFGATSSPSIAGFVLRKTALDNATHADEETVQTVLRNFYVDDLLKSTESVEKANKLILQLQELLSSGGFQLVKLLSSHAEVLNSVPDSDKSSNLTDFGLHDLPVEKALGVYWDPIADQFMVKVKVKEQPATRRGILSMVSQVFDPLGFIQPFVLPIKRLLQDTCSDGLGWDETVSDEQKANWDKWMTQAPLLENVAVRRCYKPPACTVRSIQLHVFCDASLMGYGAAAYIRVLDIDGNAHLSLVMGKSRVTPVKSVSVPRLELTAAVIGVKLGRLITSELEFQFESVNYWTDSTTVLQYIANTTTRFKIFVANRLEVIHSASSPKQWRHVDTKKNPADIASRGLMPIDAEKAKLWFEGPPFLLRPKNQWPEQPKILSALAADDPELKSKVTVNLVLTDPSDVLHRLLTRYSSLIRLKKSVAWLLRYKRYLYVKTFAKKESPVAESDVNSALTAADSDLPTAKSQLNFESPVAESDVNSALTAADLKVAMIEIVKLVQHDAFADEFKILPHLDKFEDMYKSCSKGQSRKSGLLRSIWKLSPVVVNGILYVGGRLQNSSLDSHKKHQMILPSDHHVTKLVIKYYHEKEGHCGTLHVLTAVREQFWVLRGQATVRSVLKDCRVCRFWGAKPGSQIMAPLPPERVTPGSAFAHVGLDYMGPLTVKLGRSTVKRYACVFTCLATRAVHIEVAYSLETDAFLNAYFRFCSRRGTPKSLHSDNGSNFVGAEKELKDSVRRWNQTYVQDMLSQQEVEWKFSPPAASHQGGVWERIIRSIRKIMRALVGERLLDDEALHTFLLEVERILNNRPITPASDDPTDLLPLTPSMLLLGRVDSPLPIDNFVKADGYRKSWRLVQLLSDKFWARWIREYLPILQTRQKWLKPQRNLKVGDLVLMLDENSKRGHWPKGLVDQCFPDANGIIRRVKIRTANNTYVRDVRKLCLLEAAD